MSSDGDKAAEIVRRLHIVNEEAVQGAEEAGLAVGLVTIAIVGAEVRVYGNLSRDELRMVYSAALAQLDATENEPAA